MWMTPRYFHFLVYLLTANYLETTMAFRPHAILIWGVSCSSQPGLSHWACSHMRAHSVIFRQLCTNIAVQISRGVCFNAGCVCERQRRRQHVWGPTKRPPPSLHRHLTKETKSKCGNVSSYNAFLAGALRRCEESCVSRKGGRVWHEKTFSEKQVWKGDKQAS